MTVSRCITGQGAESNGTAQVQLDDGGETFHRIQHQFRAVGSYMICKLLESMLYKKTKGSAVA